MEWFLLGAGALAVVTADFWISFLFEFVAGPLVEEGVDRLRRSKHRLVRRVWRLRFRLALIATCAALIGLLVYRDLKLKKLATPRNELVRTVHEKAVKTVQQATSSPSGKHDASRAIRETTTRLLKTESHGP